MRLHRLLPALTATLVLGAAAPAMAADVSVEVRDYAFMPAEREIAVGDRVIWTFTDDVLHSTKAVRGQADSWDSDLKSSGQTFERTFTKPGRFNYICEPHPFMKAAITVGEDAESDTVDNFKAIRRGDGVRISFKLREAATATYRLKGPSRRTIRRGRLDAGRHSFTLKNLEEGRYRGTLTLVDDFDNKVESKHSLRIR